MIKNLENQVDTLHLPAKCAIMCITNEKEDRTDGGDDMVILNIDFNSDEAIYLQLCNQIILGIAMSEIQEGEQLPSVRQLAESVGINMHTVNKAYTVLRQEGFVKVDRRRGAIISLDIDKMRAMQELRSNLGTLLARAICKNITREEVHTLVDQIFDEYRL